MNLCVIVFITLYSIEVAAFFPHVYPRLKLEATNNGNAGEPLFLTPFLKNGSISAAQEKSRVVLTERIGFRSYAGFFTVNEQYHSNLYFWYFPPFSGDAKAPVLLWLQGGPGGSSLYGLFTELGPLIPKKSGFSVRKYHWALNYHLIFIDNPVGTGFSFTKDNRGYCADEECVGVGLYNAMNQFYTLFPKLRSNDFYITGESYAGKYIPSLAMQIHRRNAASTQKINLKGLAMGNAYCDPLTQIDYGNYLYQHGLIDFNQLAVFEDIQENIKKAIMKERWGVGDILMDRLMDGEITNISYFQQYTGFNYYYNFLITDNNEDTSVFEKMLSNDEVRRMVHVGNLPFNSGQEVQIHLALDILKSVASYVSLLLSNYRILFYNGQLDIIVAYPLTEAFLRSLNFSSADEYRKAERHIWFVEDEIAGYYKVAGNLTQVLVRNAGHMVPHDQSKWALNMISQFIDNTFS